MKLKVAVTDAYIFTDLYDLGLVPSFLNLELEIYTTSSVCFELQPEHQKILKFYQSIDRIFVHDIKEEDFLQIQSESYPICLSETDKSVLHIANKLNACVVSGNKTVLNYAQNKEIKYHGMIWIFDRLVETNILTKEKAIIKLNELTSINFIFQSNQILQTEIQKRLKLWY